MNDFRIILFSCCVIASISYGGNISFEAESAVSIEAPMLLVSNAPAADGEQAASGGAFLAIPEKAGNPPKLEKGFAKYEFEVETTAAYRLWARVKWEGECSNSFSLEIDDAAPVLFGEDMTFGVWHWVKYPVSRLAGLIRLEKGRHTVVFRNREDGVAIDRIILAPDKRYVPVGKDAK